MYEGTGDCTDQKTAGLINAHGSETPRQSNVVERLSKYGMQVMPMPMPSAFQRRTRLQRQQEVDSCETVQNVPERTSISATVRRKYLKELINKSHGGFSSVLFPQTDRGSLQEDPQDADWALYPMEHAWMLSAVEGNYGTLIEFVSEDPYLLTRKDFISGYTVLHWLAKNGQDETLLQLLSYTQNLGLNVNVNVRGSGGLTPLHLASMHGRYMVIKLLVGAFSANVDAMDYNGKRAWQYLKEDAPLEMKELLGTWDEDHSCNYTNNMNRNNNCVDILDQSILDFDNCEAQQVSHFETTQTRKSLRLGSFRKLLQSFTLIVRNSNE
ncbi:ankyrin repeat domain-containing protein SOWAHC [Boleophthalmus pectinirostris]|uniref:ankyrin repeat domain-containing protein SOWAHC n=1 Tax=Boleophthalmus pectinirostris TaxID=150288 RepID=UPI000A1C6504|nr:ankyrin repeat domain-containing protein SOWAHC [Boleophthalmus pectinirostris]